MSKTYKFLQTNPPEEDIEQQTIVVTEKTYVKDGGSYVEDESKEDKFTIAQLEEDLADIDRRMANLKEQRTEKEAEIVEVKKALSIK